MKTLAFIIAVLSSVPAFAYIDAFPSYLNFGDTVVGRRSFMQSVTITNRGQDDVSFINVFPSCGLAFDVSPGSCYGPLRANQSCYVNVTFSPNREGYDSCSINISSSAGSSSISATGRGIAPRTTAQMKKGARAAPSQKKLIKQK